MLRTSHRSLDLETHTHVMGVLNATPDSFSDGGHFLDIDKAVEHAFEMYKNGADIIDIGGESTRPGSVRIDAKTEIMRVVPIIRIIKSIADIPISIDTFKAEVAAAALEAGAEIVNDVGGLKYDASLAEVVRFHNAACIIGCNSATTSEMHQLSPGSNIVRFIKSDLSEKVSAALAAGINSDAIAIDPGIGFGRTLTQDLLVHKSLKAINPNKITIVFGSSRKKFIGELLGLPVNERLFATIGSCVVAVQNGANIVRVHDVKEVVQALRVVDAVNKVSE